jgi:hypothetical protein
MNIRAFAKISFIQLNKLFQGVVNVLNQPNWLHPCD